ncbi:MAG TPA: phosphotransferase [Rhizomicrobium sp.]|jgi:aminoglycoside phosphotransferase (APT) family kinase protein
MDADLHEFLIESGLASPGAQAICTPLFGGVSCDVWRVEAEGRAICVKRPLPRLRVAAVWEAPVSRSAQEYAWLEFARCIVPRSAPKPLAHDPVRGFLALEYLEPSRHPVWKAQLLDGRIEPQFAEAVARMLAKFHAASAGDATIATRFDTGEAFFALRIDAYLLEAARRNPDVSEPLRRLADATFTTRIALVHGDVSPKNILAGPAGPVFLDAETAWFGDPAFDLAFCLNHLLLKCLARPPFASAYLTCFAAFRSAYFSGVTWENAAALELRTARLLPALLLARIDGKSPVEYLTEPDRNFVRRFACGLLLGPVDHLTILSATWKAALASRPQ